MDTVKNTYMFLVNFSDSDLERRKFNIFNNTYIIDDKNYQKLYTPKRSVLTTTSL